MLNDKSKMPFGVHKDKLMANVPSAYLLFIYEQKTLTPEVRQYIEKNKEVLQIEMKRNGNDKREKR